MAVQPPGKILPGPGDKRFPKGGRPFGPVDKAAFRYERGDPVPGGSSVRGALRSSKRGALTSLGRTGINRVSSGAGSSRSGQEYQVKKDSSGNYYHVYGRGSKARRVKLSSSVAKTYGYS